MTHENKGAYVHYQSSCGAYVKILKFIPLQDMEADGTKKGSTAPSTLFAGVGNNPGWPCQQMSHDRATESCNVTTYMTSRMPLKDAAPGT